MRDQRDARCRRRQRHGGREADEHEGAHPLRDVDERGQTGRQPVRGDQVAEQREDGAARAEDARRGATGDERRREDGVHQDDLRHARQRARRDEKQVKTQSARRTGDRPAEDDQRDRVREEVTESAVGVDARHDRPRVLGEWRREDEQAGHRLGQRGESL